jgi:dihydrofolate reductase
MSKIIVSEWMSLDGVFDGSTMGQWFAPFDSKERQAYIQQGIASCDAFLMGRNTYQMLAPYWSTLKNNEMGVAAKLNSAPKFVVSTTLKTADWNNSTIIGDNAIEEIKKLKQQGEGEIRTEGSGTLVRSLMEAGLVDEYRFLVHPIIAGTGKRFFMDGIGSGNLKLVKTQTLEHGVTLLCYQPAAAL